MVLDMVQRRVVEGVHKERGALPLAGSSVPEIDGQRPKSGRLAGWAGLGRDL